MKRQDLRRQNHGRAAAVGHNAVRLFSPRRYVLSLLTLTYGSRHVLEVVLLAVARAAPLVRHTQRAFSQIMQAVNTAAMDVTGSRCRRRVDDECAVPDARRMWRKRWPADEAGR